ncbi:hypothetical protein [Paenibacillus tarimensis]|uniref:hypothetical protein n=1 Tax=Paenibacillus tarimensis TaxID=416012 RepID=UPI001F31D48A|nr:hypothetical protein [Paenibacillus tarimensis]MCF2944782.1 hypothetical protein [Paenibacillus tarimensis]
MRCKGKGKIRIVIPAAMMVPCTRCGGTGVEPDTKQAGKSLLKDRILGWFNRGKR